jgi:ribonuclease HI
MATTAGGVRRPPSYLGLKNNSSRSIWISMNLPYVLYFDGAISKNPGGIVSYGWILDGVDRECGTAFEDGSAATNNVAEYLALICGLQSVLDYLLSNDLYHQELLVRGDSQLVINQVTGKWAVRAENMQPLHFLATRLIADIKDHGWKVEFEWIPREENEVADTLSKEGREDAD